MYSTELLLCSQQLYRWPPTFNEKADNTANVEIEANIPPVFFVASLFTVRICMFNVIVKLSL